MTYKITDNINRDYVENLKRFKGNKLGRKLAGLAGLIALTCSGIVGKMIYNDARTERLNLETKVTAPENPAPKQNKNDYEMPELNPQVVPLDESEPESEFAPESYPAPKNEENYPSPQPQPKVKTKTNYQVNDFSKDSDKVLLARMLFGEARNCSDNEKIAIAYTAVNRANDNKKWNGETMREAVLRKYQYSCFNEDDPNKVKLMNPEKYDAKAWHECLRIAKGVLSGDYKDHKGATHYHTLNCHPKWADSDEMKKLGRLANSSHTFYREK